jgi:hypothetical protein
VAHLFLIPLSCKKTGGRVRTWNTSNYLNLISVIECKQYV